MMKIIDVFFHAFCCNTALVFYKLSGLEKPFLAKKKDRDVQSYVDCEWPDQPVKNRVRQVPI